MPVFLKDQKQSKINEKKYENHTVQTFSVFLFLVIACSSFSASDPSQHIYSLELFLLVSILLS